MITQELNHLFIKKFFFYIYVNNITATNQLMYLNSTIGVATNPSATIWQTPTATTIGAGTSGALSTGNFIAYAFHSVDSYSKIGTYVGNGSTTGPTIVTGFRPAFVMIKRIDGTGAWSMFDNKRDPSNPVQKVLQAQSNAAEANVGNACNFNSNNFQLTDTNSQRNANGGTYIFIAIA